MSAPSTFWARRRAAVAAEEQALEAARSAEAEQAEMAAQAEKTDEEILAELDLPDPDTMGPGDDFARFMMRSVPQHLRNRALRRLWRSNPVLACLDGLNDYDDDYLTGSTGNGVIATSYQVGKGMLAHVERMAEDARKLAEGADAPATAGLADGAADERPAAEAFRPDAADSRAATDEAADRHDELAAEDHVADDGGIDDAETPPTPRRMRFSFDEGGVA